MGDATGALATALELSRAPSEPGELPDLVGEHSPQASLVLIENFHHADEETRRFLVEALLNPRMSYDTPAVPSFVVEGSCDYDLLLEATFPNGTPVSPLLVFAEPMTPWRRIMETEELIASLTPTRYSPAVAVWLADVTAGDAGFCNEFLLRLPDSTPNAMVLNQAYEAIVKNGATARDLRSAASRHGEELVTLLDGWVIPGSPPPSAEPRLRALYIDGFAEYDALAQGYTIRGPMVVDSLADPAGTGNKSAHRQAIVGRCMLTLWQVSRIELLLRSALARDPRTEADAKAIKAATPWKGKAEKLMAEIAALFREQPWKWVVPGDTSKRLLGEIGARVKQAVPDDRPAVDVASESLKRAGVPETEIPERIVDGFTFSDLSNLMLRLDLITSGERQSLSTANDRRNDAAHFRVGSFDDVRQLEEITRDVLARIVARVNSTSSES